ncbi:MAG: NINE protein [Gemmataceae bacterium]
MIRYSCPRCKSVLEAADHEGGAKIACPKCQQRLQIPIPPPTNKTILAPFLGQAPTPVPVLSQKDLVPIQLPMSGKVEDVEPEMFPEVLAADQPGESSNRIAVGVFAIIFGWIGVHYFLLGRVSLGIVSLILGLLGIVLLIHCIPLFVIAWSFAVYDGIRYLSMTDKQFAMIVISPNEQEKRRTRRLLTINLTLLGLYTLMLILFVAGIVLMVVGEA